MKLELTESFQKAALALNDEQRRALFDVLLGLPRMFGEPHRHGGLGIRKLHASGIWEARIGLRLRLVFVFGDDVLTPVNVLDHDDVRRMLKRL